MVVALGVVVVVAVAEDEKCEVKNCRTAGALMMEAAIDVATEDEGGEGRMLGEVRPGRALYE